MNATVANSRPNPWPIAIVVYFIIFIGFIICFTVFATRQKVDLVRADYYEEEIGFQKQLDRLNRSQSFSSATAIAYDTARQQVAIQLPSIPANATVTGNIHFYRPSDASLDQDAKLSVDARGTQYFDAKTLKTGLWKVRVQWKVNDQEYSLDQSIVIVPAPGS